MKHNPEKILRTLSKVKGQVVVSKPTIIEFPSIFREKKFYRVVKDGSVQLFGTYATIQGDDYSFAAAGTFVSFPPSKETIITRSDGLEYIQLAYEPGVLITATECVQDKLPLSELFTLYIMRGLVPWYLDYEDVLTIFQKGKFYSGLELDARPETLEVIHSNVERTKDDDTKLVRSMQIKNPSRAVIQAVNVTNVHYGAITALTKVTKSYQNAGIDSSLVTDTTKLSASEKILRDL